MMLLRGQQGARAATGAGPHRRQQQLMPLLRARTRPSSSVVVAAGRKSPSSKRSEAVAEAAAAADDSAARQLALKRVLDQINHKHGAGAVMRLGQQPMQIATTPSGCLTLDRALGGGYPRGRIVEIFGPESSGKTTLALHAVAEAQRAGGTAVFVDAEHAFDAAYARRLGVNADELIVSQPDHGEQAFNIMDDLIRSGAVDVVVVDSVSALVPRSEIDGDIGMPAIGAQARLMSQALRKVAGNASKSGVTVIFINQLRYKVGVIYGSPETTSGGQALKFYASCRLDIRAREKIMEAGRAEPVGVRARVKVVKNKVAAPFEVAEFDILFGEGIHALGCVLDAAEASGVVERRGAWYYFGEQRLGQGRDRALGALREDGALAALVEARVREHMAARRQQRQQGDGGPGLGDEVDDEAALAAAEEEEREHAAALLESAAARARELLGEEEREQELEMATVSASVSQLQD